MERAGRRAKAGSLSGLSGGLPGATPNVRRQRSLEWSGDRYSSSDEDRPQKPPQLDDRVFASLLAQATQQFDSEQRRKYGSENGEEMPRFISSPQRQASPFPLESANRRFYRRNRNSKGEEIFNGESAGGTLSRRNRRNDDFSRETNGRGSRTCQMNGPSSGAQSERECDSPPEPAPPEVPPRGPSLHVTLRHRPAPDQPADSDRLFLSEEFVMSEGGHGGSGTYPARSPMSSSTTGHSSSSHSVADEYDASIENSLQMNTNNSGDQNCEKNLTPSVSSPDYLNVEGDVTGDCEEVTTDEQLEGRRVVDIKYLFSAISNIKHEHTNCSFAELKFIKEKRNGFLSEYFFECKMCKKVERIHSEDPQMELSVNTAFVEGIMCSGNGYSQLNELSSVLNMPTMSRKTYTSIEQNLTPIIHECALDEMIAAGEEEKSLAILSGDVDTDGIPLITVVADGLIFGVKKYIIFTV